MVCCKHKNRVCKGRLIPILILNFSQVVKEEIMLMIIENMEYTGFGIRYTVIGMESVFMLRMIKPFRVLG